MRRRAMIGGTAASLIAGALVAPPIIAIEQKLLLIGVTTSIENSGMFGHLLQLFHQQHDLDVRAVTAGTGAILAMASRGDVSAIIVHAPEAETDFVAAGHGVDRRPVMHNRFVIIGPKADPAGVGGETRAADAFAAIAESASLFLSRGDQSGTHKAEQRLWKAASVDLGTEPALNVWYRESGSGQGATLNIAVNLGAYCLTDEATWASFKNRGDLETLFDRDDALMDNLYSIILANPERFPKTNNRGAVSFADWLTSPEGREAITSFSVNGKQPFRAGPKKQIAG